MKRGSRIALGLGAVLLAGIAGFAALHRPAEAIRSTPAAKAVPVVTATVTGRDVPIVVEALGTVQPIESVNVQSRVNGQIMEAYFKQGQAVKKGDPLFLIDPRPYQAALDQAKAQLAHDEALLAEAKTDLTRYQKLLKENSIASQQAEDQQYVVQQDEGTVQLDQANVETAQLNLDYCHIDAPAAGLAGAIAVDPGNYVQAGGNTTLVTITQLSPIYVIFPIPQTQLREVQTAQAKAPLDVRALSQTGEPLGEGKLTFINNQVAATTDTDTLYATLPNPDGALWPGAFVNVNLILGVRDNAITAPLNSVMSGPNGNYVYTVSPDDVAHRVPVLVVDRQNGLVVFSKGVSAGETVVVNGQYNLADNVKVAIEHPAASKAPAAAAPVASAKPAGSLR